MRKHEGTPSRRDEHMTLAANSPPGAARGRFVGGHQSGLAGCKLPPLFMRGASSCSSQRQRKREQGAPLHDGVHLPTYLSPKYSHSNFLDMRRAYGTKISLGLCSYPFACTIGRRLLRRFLRIKNGQAPRIFAILFWRSLW